MSDVTPIPKAAMEAAVRRFCRRIAATMATYMAECDISFEYIDMRCGLKSGTAENTFARLSRGQSVPIDAVSDFFIAGGCTLEFQVQSIPAQSIEEK